MAQSSPAMTRFPTARDSPITSRYVPASDACPRWERRASDPDMQEASQRRPRLDQVLQAIFIQYREESGARLLQCPRQETASLDRARSAVRPEARHKGHVRLRVTHDFAKTNRVQRFCEAQATPPAAHGGDVPGDTQLMGNLHEMGLGDIVAFRDFRDRGEAVVLECKVHQQAERVVRVDGKAQASSAR